jgi:predicted double-glycine peptidase
MDYMMMQVTTGLSSYNSAIKETVKEMSKSGLRIVDYESGRRISLEAVVRMNCLTGISQLAAEVTNYHVEDMDAKFLSTTMHAGSRESHQPWQGRVFAMNMSMPEIKRIAEERGNLAKIYGNP